MFRRVLTRRPVTLFTPRASSVFSRQSRQVTGRSLSKRPQPNEASSKAIESILLRNYPTRSVVVSHFPKAQVAVMRGTDPSEEVRVGSGIMLEDGRRGLVCGFTTSGATASCDVLVGILDHESRYEPRVGPPSIHGVHREARPYRVQLLPTPELLTQRIVTPGELLQFKVKETKHDDEAAMVLSSSQLDILSPFYVPNTRTIDTYCLFSRFLSSGAAFIDLLTPLARGQRVLLRGRCPNAAGDWSVPIVSTELKTTLASLCISQPEDTIVVRVLVGSAQDAIRAKQEVERGGGDSLRGPAVYIHADVHRHGLFGVSLIPAAVSLLLQQLLQDYPHVLVVFDNFDLFWQHLNPAAVFGADLPTGIQTFFLSAASSVMSMMSHAGQFSENEGGRAVSFVLASGIARDSPVFSRHDRDFAYLAREGIPAKQLPVRFRFVDDVTDVTVNLPSVEYLNKSLGLLTDYCPLYVPPELARIRGEFASRVEEFHALRAATQVKKLHGLFVDDWETDEVAIIESFLAMALKTRLSSMGSVEALVCLEGCLAGIKMAHHKITDPETCRQEMITFVRETPHLWKELVGAGGLYRDHHVASYPHDDLIERLRVQMEQYWSQYNANVHEALKAKQSSSHQSR